MALHSAKINTGHTGPPHANTHTTVMLAFNHLMGFLYGLVQVPRCYSFFIFPPLDFVSTAVAQAQLYTPLAHTFL